MLAMDGKQIKNILKTEGYSESMIASIMVGRRKPNADLRYKLEQKFSIPFGAWVDIKTYLQENSNIKNSNTSRLQEAYDGKTKVRQS